MARPGRRHATRYAGAVDRRPEVVPEPTQAEGDDDESQPAISQPGKLLRIASMVRELVEEVRQAGMDEQSRERIAGIYRTSMEQLKDSVSEDLQQELAQLAEPLESGASEAEVRVAQAQLLGWLEGLFHGIQAALYAQHMQAQAALEQMRRRGLPAGVPGHPHGPGVQEGEGGPGTPGQYL